MPSDFAAFDSILVLLFAKSSVSIHFSRLVISEDNQNICLASYGIRMSLVSAAGFFGDVIDIALGYKDTETAFAVT